MINPSSSVESWIHFQSLSCCHPHLVKNNLHPPSPPLLHKCLWSSQFQVPTDRFLYRDGSKIHYFSFSCWNLMHHNWLPVTIYTPLKHRLVADPPPPLLMKTRHIFQHSKIVIYELVLVLNQSTCDSPKLIHPSETRSTFTSTKAMLSAPR